MSFKTVSGWTAPTSQNVTIIAGQTVTTSGTYTPQYTLAAYVVIGHGTLYSPTGLQNANAVVTLTAAPDSGYRVKAWTGTDNDSLTTNTNTVTMTGNKTVTVEFELIPPPFLGCFGGTANKTSFGSPTGKGGDTVLLLSVSATLFLVRSRRQRRLPLQ